MWKPAKIGLVLALFLAFAGVSRFLVGAVGEGGDHRLPGQHPVSLLVWQPLPAILACWMIVAGLTYRIDNFALFLVLLIPYIQRVTASPNCLWRCASLLSAR